MNIETEVTDARREIKTDSYPMSIGELVNIYRDGDLDIHPEFQRAFRWKNHQKSKLIESILMGIPIPSVFVSQRSDGVWDVVDGVQRISTILEFLGYLKDEQGDLISPLVLEKTGYLPSLEGLSWGETDSSGLPDSLKRAFKREKIDLKIILKESDGDAKYELFQRLNTGGTKLSDQEVRNCLLIMLNRAAYDLLVNVSESSDFINCLCLNDRNFKEKYEMELILRFMIARRLKKGDTIKANNMSPYITEQMKTILVTDDAFDFTSEKNHQILVFKTLNKALGDCAFKKYNQDKKKYSGAFSVPVFEVMTTGVSLYLEAGNTEDKAIQKAKEVSEALTLNSEFLSVTTHGSRPVDRFPKSISIAKRLFC